MVKIVDCSWTTKEHIVRARRSRLPPYAIEVALVLKEHQFVQEVNDLFGHVIWLGCLEKAEHTTDAVTKLELP